MPKQTAFSVVYENLDFIVVNKYPGVVCIPDRSGDSNNLLDLLGQQYNEVYAVHRIDRDTSGLVVFARNRDTHRDLSMAFENREINKDYLAIVRGNPAIESGRIDAGLQVGNRGKVSIDPSGKPSSSLFKVLESFRGYALLQLRPELLVELHQLGIFTLEGLLDKI